jgi:hypothetical protein
VSKRRCDESSLQNRERIHCICFCYHCILYSMVFSCIYLYSIIVWIFLFHCLSTRIFVFVVFSMWIWNEIARYQPSPSWFYVWQRNGLRYGLFSFWYRFLFILCFRLAWSLTFYSFWFDLFMYCFLQFSCEQ